MASMNPFGTAITSNGGTIVTEESVRKAEGLSKMFDLAHANVEVNLTCDPERFETAMKKLGAGIRSRFMQSFQGGFGIPSGTFSTYKPNYCWGVDPESAVETTEPELSDDRKFRKGPPELRGAGVEAEKVKPAVAEELPTTRREVWYVIRPGFVRSQKDGQNHFISEARLRELYMVPRHAKVTVIPMYYVYCKEPNDVVCAPREDGKYPLFENHEGTSSCMHDGWRR